MTTRVLLTAIIALTSASAARGQHAASAAIRMNQIGFYSRGPKTAVVVGAGAGSFAVVRVANGDRPSATDSVAAPIPGLLVGGPNPGQQDHCTGYPSSLPALSYVDSTCNYAANEVAINWNAPFAFLAVATDAIFSGGAGPRRSPTPPRISKGFR